MMNAKILLIFLMIKKKKKGRQYQGNLMNINLHQTIMQLHLTAQH